MKLRDMKKEDEGLLSALNRRHAITKYIGPLVGLYKEQRAKVIETNKGAPAGIVAIIKSQAMDGSDLEILCALFSKHEGQGLATQACHAMPQ